ncbi:MAG TPA: 30S ribosomal protein S8 [Armatimonadota bacterium]|nr:30S ribosomal protein S8 [Armatimonadota bacterium]
MSMSDPIADMLTRVRNASFARHEHVEVPASRLKIEIAKILRNEGFIRNYRVLTNNKQNTIKIRLKFGPNRERVINQISRVSKPGQRVYVSKTEVPRILGGLGVAILSTSRGVLADRQARRMGVGGEVLCHVW